MESAPFYSAIADADPAAHAVWAHAPDGARTRVGLLGNGPRGTVLLFPGRTEFVEKYGPAGREFASRGYTTLAVDWRGQGLTDRPLPDRATGHVDRFEQYQMDVAAMVQTAETMHLPRPWHLVAHSMGGGIGLRALHSGLPVASAVFSGPMWGIYISPILRPAAWALTTVSRPLGFGGKIVPGSDASNYVLEAEFEDNVLTTDPEVFAWMKAQLKAHPELALGGPSMTWVNEALLETRALARLPAPNVPCLCVTGENERIVDVADIRAQMAKWPSGRLIIERGAEHEIMMERPDVRTRFFDLSAALFDENTVRKSAS
ncbi:MAG: alpha/beta hydrolase [Pseudomonadota bacterium]